MLERLTVLDEYLKLAAPDAKAAADAGKKLGVAGRTVYHLLGKLRDHGPVRGLTPGYRLKRRSSIATAGLGEVAEQAMATFLDQRPDARVGEVYRVVQAASEEAKVQPPSETDLRRRLHELRRTRARPLGPRVRFGRSLLVDQTSIDFGVETFFRRREQAAVTILIDRPTTIICGIGVSVSDSGDIGLMQAVFDASTRRLPMLASLPIPVASALEEVEWIVPPGMEGAGERWLEFGRSAWPDLRLRAVDNRPKRHGGALLRLIGDKLGDFTLKVRVPIARELVADATVPIYSPETASLLVHRAADAWNRRVLERIGARKPKEGAVEREAALSALTDQLRALFLPVYVLPQSVRDKLQ